jgi:AcrR family transcriptional regulator
VNTAAKPGPRERLLRAAQELTYARGAGVGVDAILQQADVARRSLYQHFGGKDGLIAEVIRASAAEEEARYRAAMDAGGDDPRQRLLAVFDALDEITSGRGFRGCRYLAADLTLVDPGHPAHAETRAYRQRVHRLLEQQLEKLGHRNPAHAADQLQLLIEGTLVTGVTRPETRPAKTARELAEHVLDSSH